MRSEGMAEEEQVLGREPRIGFERKPDEAEKSRLLTFTSSSASIDGLYTLPVVPPQLVFA